MKSRWLKSVLKLTRNFYKKFIKINIIAAISLTVISLIMVFFINIKWEFLFLCIDLIIIFLLILNIVNYCSSGNDFYISNLRKNGFEKHDLELFDKEIISNNKLKFKFSDRNTHYINLIVTNNFIVVPAKLEHTIKVYKIKNLIKVTKDTTGTRLYFRINNKKKILILSLDFDECKELLSYLRQNIEKRII